MKRSKPLVWALVGVLVLQPSVGAITRIDRGSRLYVKLSTNSIAISQTDAGDPIGDINPFSVRSGETTEIWIFDPNPLLFRYEVTTTTEDTQDFKAALAFAKEFAILLGRFPGSAAAADMSESIVEGLALTAFRTDLVAVQRHVAELSQEIEESLDVDSAKKMKENVKTQKLTQLADDVDSAYTKLIGVWTKCMSGASLADQDGQPVSCDAPFDLRPMVRERRLLLALAKANADLAAAKPDAVARAKEAAAAIQTALHGLRTGDLKDAAAAAAGGLTIRNFVNSALAAQTQIASAASTLRAFDKDVDALLTPRKLESRPYSLQLQKITLRVKAETKYDGFTDAKTKKKRADRLRDVNISLQPHAVASLRPGVGFVLGFLRNPAFSTVKEGDAFRIVQNDSGLTRYTVAAMLNIVPARWDEPTFGGYFQLGVSPKNDETGFFFGAGISAQSLLTFGGGLMLQQVRQLAPGLSLDRTLAKPEDLKTQTVFKPAFYVHGTVTLPK